MSSNNRILNTLQDDFFWRILGFLSSFTGLLSYLLSSSFHSIFSEMNTWKTLLYISVSLIVPYNILFAKTWKLPQNFFFRSHVPFLVLFITSVYSYFYDKCVKEKPDMFSLVSSGSFVLMSLSLQAQKIHLGFEDDLLRFFLGFLTIQLMKINLSLCFVGAAFCYLAVVLIPSCLDSRSSSETNTVQESVAIKIDTCAYDLRRQLCSILGIENDSENPERFVYPSDFESKLKDAIKSGFVKECYDVFITWRKQFLNDKLFSTTGFQKLSIEEVHKLPLKYLKNDIEEWTKVCDLVVKTLFPLERHACNVVFSGLSPPLDELSFMEVCRGLTTQLLNYANAVSTTTQSPERLFRIVDVLETLEEILPNMESLFCNQSCGLLYDEAIAVCNRLEETITGVFVELENLIRQDPANLAVAGGGGLHPTNRYVMNYLRAACRCRKKLERVFDATQVSSSLSSSSSSSSLSEQMLRILDLLETNLVANSKFYNNDSSALCPFFMMNNIRYMVHEAKISDLADLLGDDWVQNHILKVRQYLVTYQRSSWDRVLELLNIMDPGVDESLVQEKLELFKLQFEEICKNQSSWVIFDDHLRNVITSSLRKIVLLAYENFMIKFLNHVEAGDFGVLVIEGLINKLFMGKDEHTNPRNVQPITWTVVLPSSKDFHEWRKYGEKTIPNSTHPRKYYRCIYKNGQDCGARKHVQKIQENPKMYKTCYSGFHTCCL